MGFILASTPGPFSTFGGEGGKRIGYRINFDAVRGESGLILSSEMGFAVEWKVAE